VDLSALGYRSVREPLRSIRAARGVAPGLAYTNPPGSPVAPTLTYIWQQSTRTKPGDTGRHVKPLGRNLIFAACSYQGLHAYLMPSHHPPIRQAVTRRHRHEAEKTSMRTSKIDEAIGMGTLRSRYPREPALRDFHERIMTIRRGATRPELPF